MGVVAGLVVALAAHRLGQMDAIGRLPADVQLPQCLVGGPPCRIQGVQQGFNFDPSHLIWQGIKPERFIDRFADRIYHVHIKDAAVTLDGDSGILSSYLNFGDHRRGWDFRSPGRGDVDFESIIRVLNRIGYDGPLSVEWEDSGMDREHGAREACELVREVDFKSSELAFDAAFEKE